MNQSPKEHLINPAYEDDYDYKTTLRESFQLNEITNPAEEAGHSNRDHGNRYEVNPPEAKPAQGSNRALFILVIIVCLISLLALLLTILMLVGNIGASNEAKTRDYDHSLLDKVNALQENITSPPLSLAKPSAHIVAAYFGARKSVGYSINSVMKSWSDSLPHSHVKGGMKYKNGNLTVPKAGMYYIYVHLKFGSKGRVQVRVNNAIVSLITAPVTAQAPEATSSSNGVFVLNAGDSISLKIHPWGAPLDGVVKFWMRTDLCYFGAFLI